MLRSYLFLQHLLLTHSFDFVGIYLCVAIINIRLCLFCSCDVYISNPGIGSNTRSINVPVNDICVDQRNLVYSLARILELPDEHTRPDKNRFLTIHWDNIQSKINLNLKLLILVTFPYQLYTCILFNRK